jgi:hypothetical protein
MVNIIRRPRPSPSILKAFIEKSIKEGISANEALRKLQEIGYGMRRQEFLRAFREIANLPAKKDAFVSTPMDKVFSSKNYRVNENKPRGFLTVFKVELQNKMGTTATHYLSVKHNKPLTKREFINKLRDYARNLYIDIEGNVLYDEETSIKDDYRVQDIKVLGLEDAYKGWVED